MTCRPIIRFFFPTPVVHIDPAKYLLTRLCLRKPGKWHRLSSLQYQHELGENITAILEMLCVSSNPNTTEHHAIKQEQEIIDLTLHEMDLQDSMKSPPASLLEQPKVEAGPSSVKIEDIYDQPCEDLSFFARDHTYAGLPELLNCLSLEELRQLAKDMKIRKPFVNVSSLPHFWCQLLSSTAIFVQRAVLEGVLIKHASSQSILPFYSVHPKAKAENRLMAHARLPLTRKPQWDRLRQMVMKILGTFPVSLSHPYLD